MKKLKYLNLKNNNIVDIIFLNNILDIEELYLENNKIKDFSLVLKLEKLEIINIKNQKLLLKDINSEENIEKSNCCCHLTINENEKKYFYYIIDEIKKKVPKCLSSQQNLDS